MPLFSEEQFNVGILSWDADVPPACKLDICVISGDPQNPLETGPYRVRSGSPLHKEPENGIALRVNFGTTDSKFTPVLRTVRLERPVGTIVWEGVSPSVGFRFARGFGWNHRLVYAPDSARWETGHVVITPTARLRFTQQPLRGSKVTGFSRALAGPAGDTSSTGSVDEVAVEGSLIEIITTTPLGDSEAGDFLQAEVARDKAEAIAGLIAVVGGRQTLGAVVFNESFRATRDGEGGFIDIPANITGPRQLAPGEFGSLAQVVDQLETESADLARALQLTLRWYRKAVLADIPEESFLSAFIGLESLTSALFDRQPSMPRPELTEFETLVQEHEATSQQLKNLVRTILGDWHMRAKFEAVAGAIGLPESDLLLFRELSALRSQLVHGSIYTIDRAKATDAERLLARLVRCALSLPLPSEMEQQVTRVFGLRLHFALSQVDPTGKR